MRRVVLLVVSGLLLGAALTGAAGALPGSQDLTALTWLGTVSTVAALVVAVGIYQVQQAQSDAAHQELLDALKAQDEILQNLTDTDTDGDTGTGTGADTDPTASTGRRESDSPESEPERDLGLTAAQREAIEAQYGDRSIDETFNPRGARAVRGNGPRLVRLDDGTLLTVFDRGRGRVQVHQVRPRRERGRSSRGRRSGPG